MLRRVEDPRPIKFADLDLPNQTDGDRRTTTAVIRKFAADPDLLTFQFVRVPVVGLIESVIVEAVARKNLPADVYVNWRKAGAPDAPLRDPFEKVN